MLQEAWQPCLPCAQLLTDLCARSGVLHANQWPHDGDVCCPASSLWPALQQAARAGRRGGGAACANACADDDQGPAGIRSKLAASRAGAQLIACFRELLRERRVNEFLGGAAHRAHRKIGVCNGF